MLLDVARHRQRSLATSRDIAKGLWRRRATSPRLCASFHRDYLLALAMALAMALALALAMVLANGLGQWPWALPWPWPWPLPWPWPWPMALALALANGLGQLPMAMAFALAMAMANFGCAYHPPGQTTLLAAGPDHFQPSPVFGFRLSASRMLEVPAFSSGFRFRFSVPVVTFGWP